MKFKNLPNLLTVSRIVLVIIFVVMATLAEPAYFNNSPDRMYQIRWIAYILVILAGVTDLLDGYLARKFNIVSDFGALMDPLADKIFVTGTMLIAIEYKLMPAFIAVLVLCREFMVTGLRTLAAKKQIVISADRWGKLKTALQMAMLAIAGFAWVMDGGVAYLHDAKWFGVRIWYIWLAYLWSIVLVTVLSGAGYFFRYRSLYLPEETSGKGE
ncbi:MAG: CDP-diacylglycerol--glycerol-3-phosphate 3-phosphatidyltransferase [Lentisphaeria bacterium]|jgi:CDP-diacylglycerol--glycerol-3-phosphate 3-phosphatidyltransferase|nr:CDP-diacylglycerol--glycerol-3-phosphate 3-phosphatidyltransferase [Lentisphaeria bacterium]